MVFETGLAYHLLATSLLKKYTFQNNTILLSFYYFSPCSVDRHSTIKLPIWSSSVSFLPVYTSDRNYSMRVYLLMDSSCFFLLNSRMKKVDRCLGIYSWVIFQLLLIISLGLSFLFSVHFVLLSRRLECLRFNSSFGGLSFLRFIFVWNLFNHRQVTFFYVLHIQVSNLTRVILDTFGIRSKSIFFIDLLS